MEAPGNIGRITGSIVSYETYVMLFLHFKERGSNLDDRCVGHTQHPREGKKVAGLATCGSMCRYGVEPTCKWETITLAVAHHRGVRSTCSDTRLQRPNEREYKIRGRTANCGWKSGCYCRLKIKKKQISTSPNGERQTSDRPNKTKGVTRSFRMVHPKPTYLVGTQNHYISLEN